jgi:hypothetical protein
MNIKFSVVASDLNTSLDVVSIVPPKALTPAGESGYLFVIKGDTCFLYSRDTVRAVRSSFKISDVSGEGSFIYPADYVGGFKFLGDALINFEVTSEGSTHKVSYSTKDGASSERATFDPRLMTALDKDFEEATGSQEFLVPLFKDALSLSKTFMAKPGDTRVEDHFKSAQLFDDSKAEWAKGNGTLFAANGAQAFYFYSDAFQGKSFSVHAQHLPFLQNFLSKAGTKVTLSSSPTVSYLSDSNGNIFGWVRHTKTYQKYSYYSLSLDKFVFSVPVSVVLNALKYLKTEMGSKQDRIKFHYSASDNSLSFQTSEGQSKVKSFPVPVSVKHIEDSSSNCSFFVNVNHFMDILNGANGNELELRVAVISNPNDKKAKSTFMIRTIDEYIVNGEGKIVAGSGVKELPEGSFKCQITRFTPSML